MKLLQEMLEKSFKAINRIFKQASADDTAPFFETTKNPDDDERKVDSNLGKVSFWKIIVYVAGIFFFSKSSKCLHRNSLSDMKRVGEFASLQQLMPFNMQIDDFSSFKSG